MRCFLNNNCFIIDLKLVFFQCNDGARIKLHFQVTTGKMSRCRSYGDPEVTPIGNLISQTCNCKHKSVIRVTQLFIWIVKFIMFSFISNLHTLRLSSFNTNKNNNKLYL